MAELATRGRGRVQRDLAEAYVNETGAALTSLGAQEVSTDYGDHYLIAQAP